MQLTTSEDEVKPPNEITNDKWTSQTFHSKLSFKSGKENGSRPCKMMSLNCGFAMTFTDFVLAFFLKLQDFLFSVENLNGFDWEFFNATQRTT